MNLNHWLKTFLKGAEFEMAALAGDASFRQYFRLWVGPKKYIVMDASKEKKSCRPFVTIAKKLRTAGLRAPEIFAENLEEGFLLLEDFGDDLFLRVVTPQTAEAFYETATSAVAQMQKLSTDALPIFDRAFAYSEFSLFKEWFLDKFLKLIFTPSEENSLQNSFVTLTEEIDHQPKTFMHRDFHSANLMILKNNAIGILDFQDAMLGPVTYDLVSLLRDCYIAWPDTFVYPMVLNFKNKIKWNVSDEIFLQWFDWMSLQRHMKALMTFSRKYLRDNNPNYLQHIPRTLNYIDHISRKYPEIAPFLALFQNKILPAFERNNVCVP